MFSPTSSDIPYTVKRLLDFPCMCLTFFTFSNDPANIGLDLVSLTAGRQNQGTSSFGDTYRYSDRCSAKCVFVDQTLPNSRANSTEVQSFP